MIDTPMAVNVSEVLDPSWKVIPRLSFKAIVAIPWNNELVAGGDCYAIYDGVELNLLAVIGEMNSMNVACESYGCFIHPDMISGFALMRDLARILSILESGHPTRTLADLCKNDAI